MGLFLVLLGFLGLQLFPRVSHEGVWPIMSLVFGLSCIAAALVTTYRAR
jgi:hypothetical protein